MEVRPMRANPGGHIPPEDVVGRDDLIRELWAILEGQSLVLSAERRIGKTSLIRKMIVECPQDKCHFFHDLEDVHTTFEFSKQILHDVDGELSLLGHVASKARQFIENITGTEVGRMLRVPEHLRGEWKGLLLRTLEDLSEHQKKQGRRIIFFWDEVPLMLGNIKRHEGEEMAMELLDTLRHLRQTHLTLRMVFTGSIGFHNVLTSLRQVGYANDPLNDMFHVIVPPLSAEDATELTLCLFEGEEIEAEDRLTMARTLAAEVDDIPYYIHHVVAALRSCPGQEVSPERIRQVVADSLTRDNDPWHVGHYQNRIRTYYPEEDRPFALGLLDALSTAEHPLAFDDLFNLLKARLATEDREKALEVLRLLRRDHYVTMEPDGTHRFTFSIVQRWWRLNRGLGGETA